MGALRHPALMIMLIGVVGTISTGCGQGGASPRTINGPYLASPRQVGHATKVVGLTARFLHDQSEVNSISCAASGSCVAGGYYVDPKKGWRAFLVSEEHGIWKRAFDVQRSTGPTPTSVDWISCTAVGFCTATGSYGGAWARKGAFVVSEKNGIWGEAVSVADLGGPKYRTSDLHALSCGTVDSCVAGGGWDLLGFVMDETHSAWGKPVELRGSARLHAVGGEVRAISCPTADSCAAGGVYLEGSPKQPQRAFVVNRVHGIWGKAVRVQATGTTLNYGNEVQLWTMSCATGNSCVAGGSFLDRHYHYQAFVLRERNGVWGRALKVPGLETYHVRDGEVDAVSCPTRNWCAAVGDFDGKAFVVTEMHGIWQNAEVVKGPTPHVESLDGAISCVRAGICTAAFSGDVPLYWHGYGPSRSRAYVVSSRNGVWGKAVALPGVAALGTSATLNEVSCPTAHYCAVAGTYEHDLGLPHALVTGPGR